MTARLLLKTEDFDAKIQQSKTRARDFGREGQSSTELLGRGFTRLATIIGAAASAEALFERGLNSSRGLAERWNTVVSSSQSILGEFSGALLRMDFSVFEGGLDSLISKTRDFYYELNNLKGTLASADFANNLSDSKFKLAEAVVSGKDTPHEKRVEAYEEMIDAWEDVIKTTNVQEQRIMKTFKSFVAKETGFSYPYNVEQIEAALSAQASGRSMGRIEAEYEAYRSERDAVQPIQFLRQAIVDEQGYGRPEDIDLRLYNANADDKFKRAVNDRMNHLYKVAVGSMDLKNKQLILDYALNVASSGEGEESFDSFINLFSTLKSGRDKVAEMQKTLDSAAETVKANSPEGQFFAAYDKMNEHFAKKRKEAEKEAKASRKAERELAAEYSAMLSGYRTIDVGEAVRPAAPAAGKVPDKITSFLDPDAQWESILMANSEASGDQIEKWTQGVDMLSSSFGSLGNAIGGAAGEMLVFVGSMIDAASAIIPLIAQLMAEKVAHDAVASSATAEAAAKAMSAHAGIPFAGIALGLSAVGAIVAAMTSLPQFAQGGIVTSATLGVFGEAGPEAVMPLDRLKDFIGSRDVRVTGEIRRRGKDLVMVIDNYKKTRSVKNG